MTGTAHEDTLSAEGGEGVPLTLFESLFTAAPIGLGLVDREFRYLRVNDALARINGLPPEAHLGRTVAEVVPHLWPQLEPLYRQAVGGEQVTTRTVREARESPSGQVRHFLANYAPLTDATGVCGVGIVVVDVSDAQYFQAALTLRTDLYRMMAETNRAILSATSREALFQEICRIAVEVGHFRCAWVGVLERNEVRCIASAGEDGGYVAALVIPTDPTDPRAQGPTGRAARDGGVVVVNDFFDSALTAPWHEAARRAGFAASAAFPLRERGEVVAVLTLYAAERGYFTGPLVETLHEITPTVSLALDGFAQARDRQTLERQVQVTQKMEAVGQLASGVAHDFNNILTVINGCGELLDRELPPDGTARELLTEIREAGERATTLTRQLLAFSRQQVITPQLLDLNRVVSGSESLIRRLIGDDILLTTELAEPLWATQADPGQLEQVLLNLAVNARDAMPGGGTLVVRSHCEARPEASAELPAGEFVVLEVSDSGTGMDAETRQRLFEPFFTTKAPGKGTGLGLATVATIVRDARGRVTVSSELGQGTTFRVYLPRAEGAAADPAPAPASGTLPRGTETVLLVEDDDALRQLVRTMLRGLGYTVLEASNGAAAITMARALDEPIHLLLSDVVMPHLGGRQLADVLLATRPQCRVLFLSGYNAEEMLHRGVVDSPKNFLQKPFTVQELAHQIRAVLDLPR